MPLIGTRGAASAQGFGEFAQQATAVQANAIDYDTTNDYLFRNSVYNGYVDIFTFLKDQFTFSCWFYNAETGGDSYVFSSGESSGTVNQFFINVSTTAFEIRAYDGSGNFILNASRANTFPLNTFCNVLISIDMTSTSRRYVYVNDVLQTMTWSNYVNSTIQFGSPVQRVNSLSYTVVPTGCRISNVFLDFNYRDLSITANRRLFVTADLKPAANQQAMNPIVYLPMSDPTNPGLNQGTGGNFTLTGVVARSGRGPNQYNAPYSDLDGTADYLSRTTAPTGIADGKQGTFQCVFNNDNEVSASTYIITFSTSTTIRFFINLSGNGAGNGFGLSVQGYNSSGTRILWGSYSGTDLRINRNYILTISFDLSNTSNRHVYINGSIASFTWNTFTNDNIDFAITTTPRYYIGADPTPANYLNGRLGALWFNTSYIDLSQPDNLAKFVTGTGIDAKPVDLGANGELPTGTSPLIYLPMYGNNAGKNYGTGGDFTVNSGPYTGARGPNEFWGNKANFDGTTGYLSRTTALGLSDGKTFSMSFWYAPNSSSAANYIYYTDTSGGSARVYVLRDASNNLNIVAKNSAGTNILNATVTTGVFSSNSVAKCIQICIDLTSTSLRKIYVDGVNQTSITWTTYTNDNINWNVQNTRISTASNGLSGNLSEFYFTTDYIDFSQEANRLKFVDAFGNPVDLTQQIEDAAIPNPAIYMRFPPTAFGTNYGTGGDFTVNGTITDGGQL